MAKFTNLRVWHQSRELLRLVSAATADMRAEGDLKSQMRRAAISVASNIAEGAERPDREFRRFLTIVQARDKPSPSFGVTPHWGVTSRCAGFPHSPRLQRRSRSPGHHRR